MNISSRGSVTAGDGLLIGGFIVTGNPPKRVLVRASGPALAAYGLSGVLADPRLAVYGGPTLLARNDNWETPVTVNTAQVAATSAEIAAAATQVGAFALPAGSKEATVILTLAPGSYTAQISGVANGSGVALIEIYEIP